VKGPAAILLGEGPGSMQIILLSCLFGAVCTIVLWAAGSASVMRDRMMRRGGELFPPEDV
jgi:hypothetical protein